MNNSALRKEFTRFLKGELRDDILKRLDSLDDFHTLPNSDYDLFGASKGTLSSVLPQVAFFYKFYFKMR